MLQVLASLGNMLGDVSPMLHDSPFIYFGITALHLLLCGHHAHDGTRANAYNCARAPTSKRANFNRTWCGRQRCVRTRDLSRCATYRTCLPHANVRKPRAWHAHGCGCFLPASNNTRLQTIIPAKLCTRLWCCVIRCCTHSSQCELSYATEPGVHGKNGFSS